MKKKDQMLAKIKRQQEITDGARAANRDLTDDETREFNNLQGEIDALRPQVEEEERQAAITAERNRVAEINAICRQVGMEPDNYIKDGSTVEAVRKAALDQMIQRGQPSGVHVTQDEGDKVRAAAVDGLLMRAGVTVENPTDGAREFQGMSLRDIAIESMTRSGNHSASELLRMSKSDLYDMASREFFNPSAAFPAILDEAIKKAIVEPYTHAGTTFERWTRKGSLSDFKPTPDHDYVLSGAQDFEKVPENGELKESEFSTEMLPQRKLDTYGRSFSMSRQAFINDDIGFIATVPGRFAQAAKRTINKQCYQLLYNNAAVFDGKAFFSADHKNLLTTGTGMTSAAIKEMRQKLRTQTDQFGEAITLTPNFLILPVSEQYDNDLVSIFMSPTIQTTENTQAANPLYRQNYDIIEDNTLNVLAGSNACPWFMGDKGVPWEGIKQIFGNAFNALVELAKVPINAVIALINGAIDGINSLTGGGISIPDWVPVAGGQTFSLKLNKIPALAHGGFTQGVSIAGEAGTEAVISFMPTVRSANINTWQQAGRMLGVNQQQAAAVAGAAQPAASASSVVVIPAAVQSLMQQYAGATQGEALAFADRQVEMATAAPLPLALTGDGGNPGTDTEPTDGDDRPHSAPQTGGSSNGNGGAVYQYAPQFIFQGAANREDVEAANKMGMTEFRRMMEQYEKDNSRRRF